MLLVPIALAAEPLTFRQDNRYQVEVCNTLLHPVELRQTDPRGAVTSVELAGGACTDLDRAELRRGDRAEIVVTESFYRRTRDALLTRLAHDAQVLARTEASRAEWEARRGAELDQQIANISGETAQRVAAFAGIGAAGAAVNATFGDDGPSYRCVSPGSPADDGTYSIARDGQLCKEVAPDAPGDALLVTGGVGALIALLQGYEAANAAREADAWKQARLDQEQARVLEAFERTAQAIPALDAWHRVHGEQPVPVEPFPLGGYGGGLSPLALLTVRAAPFETPWSEDWGYGDTLPLPWGATAGLRVAVSPEWTWPVGGGRREERPISRFYAEVAGDTYAHALLDEGATLGGVASADPLGLRVRQLRAGAALTLLLDQELQIAVGGGVPLFGTALLLNSIGDDGLYGPLDEVARFSARSGGYGSAGITWSLDTPDRGGRGLGIAWSAEALVQSFPAMKLDPGWPLHDASGAAIPLPEGIRASASVGVGVSF